MPDQQGDSPRVVGFDAVAGTAAYPSGAVLLSVEVPKLAGWEVEVLVPVDGDNPFQVVELSIRPQWDATLRRRVVPRRGISSATLRSIPLVAILRAGFEPITKTVQANLIQDFFVGEAPRPIRRSEGGCPPKYDEQFYARVAIDWERQTHEGRGAFGRFAAERDVPRSTAKNWVTRATELGFLHPAAGVGSQARRATPRARQIANADGGEGGVS